MLTCEQVNAIYETAIMNDDRYASQEVREADDAHENALMAYTPPFRRTPLCVRMNWAIRLGMRCSHDLDQHQPRRYHGIIQGH